MEGLAAKVSPAVVQILVTGYGPLHEENRSQTALIVRQHAVGSGVIVDPDGYIMTNDHVVEGAQRIRVALPLPGDNGRPVARRQTPHSRGQLIGVHKETDLALLKIDETDLPTLPLLPTACARRPTGVRHRQPEGLQNSVTMGVVSAVARQPDPEKAHDLYSDRRSHQSRQQRRTARRYEWLRARHQHFHSLRKAAAAKDWASPFPRASWISSTTACASTATSIAVEIGAAAQEITPTLAEGLNLAQHWGVIIADVKPDGPAAAAGLKIQDIVLTRRRSPHRNSSSAVFRALSAPPRSSAETGNPARRPEENSIHSRHRTPRPVMDQLFDAADAEKRVSSPAWAFSPSISPTTAKAKSARCAFPEGVVVLGRAADLITPDTGLQTGDVIHAASTPLPSPIWQPCAPPCKA